MPGTRHGLDRAYGNSEHTYVQDGVLYVAGTNPTRMRDLLDDALLPLGGVKRTARYDDAIHAMRGRKIQKVVGHSLGAAVAKQVAADYDVDASFYALPGITLRPDRRSHRQWFDPVSLFDRGAKRHRPTLNPHSYAEAP